MNESSSIHPTNDAIASLHPAVKGVLAHFEADVVQAEESGVAEHVHTDFADFAQHFAISYRHGAADLADALRKLYEAKNAMILAVRTHMNAVAMHQVTPSGGSATAAEGVPGPVIIPNSPS